MVYVVGISTWCMLSGSVHGVCCRDQYMVYVVGISLRTHRCISQISDMNTLIVCCTCDVLIKC